MKDSACGRQALLGMGIALGTLGGVGAIYQAISTQLDKRKCPPPGQLVDVDRHRLHLQMMGADRGGPTVVLEAALGSISSEWAWVQPEISRFARVISYDRAGLGWSEPGPRPRDARRIAVELRTALRNAEIEGPYVLVGHSLGCLFTRVFADLFPEDVAGMVLVDASHPEQWVRLPSGPGMQRTIKSLVAVGPILARLGVLRLMSGSRLMGAGDLPPRQRAEFDASFASTGQWEARAAEVAAWEDLTNPQTRGTSDLGDKPLVVLSAGESIESVSGSNELQAELASLSSAGEHRIVGGAAHMGLVTDPRHAHEVVSAARRVVAAARTHQPHSR